MRPSVITFENRPWGVLLKNPYLTPLSGERGNNLGFWYTFKMVFFEVKPHNSSHAERPARTDEISRVMG